MIRTPRVRAPTFTATRAAVPIRVLAAEAPLDQHNLPRVLDHNLGNFLWQLALLREVSHWGLTGLTTLREKLIKIGAKVVRYAKAVTFQLAGVAVPRALFAAILGRTGWLREAPSLG